MQTDRDAQIVYWIGSLGAAGAEHVMRQFQMSRSVTYQRLNSLTRDGLLEHQAAREIKVDERALARLSTPGPHWESRVMADSALQEQYA